MVEHSILLVSWSTSCTYVSAGSKSLGFRHAVRIEERLLSNPRDTITSAISQAIVVKSGCMKNAAVVPDSCLEKRHCQPIPEELESGGKFTNVILVSPFETDLQIVVVQDCRVELFEELVAFVRVKFVDVFCEIADGKDTFPSAGEVSTRLLELCGGGGGFTQ